MLPIIKDQYTAGRAYFLCVIGMLVVESCIQLPPYLLSLRQKGRPYLKPSSTHSKIYLSIHRILNLPSPFPVITNLPVADLVRLAVLFGLNMLWGWNRNEYSGDFRLYGWLTIANGGLTLLMAARSNLFSVVARIPSSTLLLYHRWIGRATVIHATLHFSLNTRLYLKNGQLQVSYSNRRIQIGIMAWLSLSIMFITSIPFIRRRWFEAFYYPHALFLIFVVCASIHAIHGPEFLMPGLGLWLIDRAIRFTRNFRSIRVLSATQYPGNLTKFKISGLHTTEPNQITWLQLPSVSHLNWHPFTVISAPGETEATLAIRGLGGYTKLVQLAAADAKKDHQDRNPESNSIAKSTSDPDHCTDKSLLRMRLDGPHGIGDVLWGTHQLTVLVAGGIGITPGMSIAMHIVKTAQLASRSQPQSLTRSQSQTHQQTMPAVESPMQRHIHLLWTVKDAAHIHWFEDELRALASIAADPRVPVTFDVAIHVSHSGPGTYTPASSSPEPKSLLPPPRSSSSAAAESHSMTDLSAHPTPTPNPITAYTGPGTVTPGRPNIARWFDDVRAARPGMDAVVNACGPRAMIRDVRKAAAAAGPARIGKGGEGGRVGAYYVSEEVFER